MFSLFCYGFISPLLHIYWLFVSSYRNLIRSVWRVLYGFSPAMATSYTMHPIWSVRAVSCCCSCLLWLVLWGASSFPFWVLYQMEVRRFIVHTVCMAAGCVVFSCWLVGNWHRWIAHLFCNRLAVFDCLSLLSLAFPCSATHVFTHHQIAIHLLSLRPSSFCHSLFLQHVFTCSDHSL